MNCCQSAYTSWADCISAQTLLQPFLCVHSLSDACHLKNAMNRFLHKIHRSEVRCQVLISPASSNSLHTVIPSVSWVQGFLDNHDVHVLHYILFQQLKKHLCQKSRTFSSTAFVSYLDCSSPCPWHKATSSDQFLALHPKHCCSFFLPV